ncbi:RICIN domain-containing protein [Longimicrobium sp.]|jgi:hypothetical protein|uniref:RICIN domain-containing protein n=1 Tax=Longimicrobium sp. TaxID=2029185 RepID=UPI002ED946D0
MFLPRDQDQPDPEAHPPPHRALPGVDVARQSDGHKITAAHSGKALDVGGGSTAEGADVITWPWLANDCQRWDVVNGCADERAKQTVRITRTP